MTYVKHASSQETLAMKQSHETGLMTQFARMGPTQQRDPKADFFYTRPNPSYPGSTPAGAWHPPTQHSRMNATRSHTSQLFTVFYKRMTTNDSLFKHQRRGAPSVHNHPLDFREPDKIQGIPHLTKCLALKVQWKGYHAGRPNRNEEPREKVPFIENIVIWCSFQCCPRQTRQHQLQDSERAFDDCSSTLARRPTRSAPTMRRRSAPLLGRH